MINYIKGNLITMALEGNFDVIAHGCNCFCLQGAGIAKQMAKTFKTNYGSYFNKEHFIYSGSINKLGTIDSCSYALSDGEYTKKGDLGNNFLEGTDTVTIVNAYTQFEPGSNADLTAIRMCFKKMNHIFKGKHIGLPKIGTGIGGLDWKDVEQIINEEFTDCETTVVIYKP